MRELTLVRLSVALAIVSLLTYLLIASSPQYQDYAPVGLSSGWLYVAYVICGGLVAIVTRSWLAIVGIAILPPTIFGVALVVLPGQLGLVAVLGLYPFVVWSLQRVFMHLLFSLSLVAVGAFLGLWLRETVSF